MFDPLPWLEVALKMVVAIVLGGLLGLEREIHGRWAGFRTHMMVSVGAATFVLAGIGVAENSPESLSRVVQGVATGIGFLGAGTVLKLTDRVEVKGLTTASSIWLAAAVGTATGLGEYDLAVITAIISLIVLAALRPLGKKIERDTKR